MRAMRGAYRGVLWWILTGLLVLLTLGLLALGHTGPLRGSAFVDRLATAVGALGCALTVLSLLVTLRAEKADQAGRLTAFRNAVRQQLMDEPKGYFAGPGEAISVAFRDGAAADAVVTVPLAAYLAAERPGWRRLVILGEPGSGKTVAAHQLTADLMRSRKEDDPVPVRIPLSTWNTERELVDWLADHLTDRGLVRSRTVARELLKARLVLPVLDGLDEMDPPHVRPRDTRALKALDRLNEEYGTETGRARLVVVCRTGRYRELARTVRLHDATTITLQPLSSDQQRQFLAAGGVRDEAGNWDPAWQGIAAALDWTGTPRGLARVLNTPWRMALLTTAYTSKEQADDYRPLRSPDSLLAMRRTMYPTTFSVSTRMRPPRTTTGTFPREGGATP
ncbi:NACHT domain-containing protein [Streptomyces cinerochromogenes]|uniref:NACHT domain-containing protein n=1 Tax=Streptomyces cinerochromogenes TaxID=66422 RepID=A0ABW7BA38_9ACTN